MKREQVQTRFGGRCAYTGQILGNDWQIDHVMPQYRFKQKYVEGNADEFYNLIPCISIINHYKRGKDLEQFREYMKTFHIRLAKLPKTTKSNKALKRIEYMKKISQLFDITVDKPFNGVFYFESQL